MIQWRGNITLPNDSPPSAHRRFKSVYKGRHNRFVARQGIVFGLNATTHITNEKNAHYDFVGYSSGISQTRLRAFFSEACRKSGGLRCSLERVTPHDHDQDPDSLTTIEDDELKRVTRYATKADGGKNLGLRRNEGGLNLSWNTKEFWGDGGKKAVWKAWVSRMFPPKEVDEQKSSLANISIEKYLTQFITNIDLKSDTNEAILPSFVNQIIDEYGKLKPIDHKAYEIYQSELALTTLDDLEPNSRSYGSEILRQDRERKESLNHPPKPKPPEPSRKGENPFYLTLPKEPSEKRRRRAELASKHNVPIDRADILVTSSIANDFAHKLPTHPDQAWGIPEIAHRFILTPNYVRKILKTLPAIQTPDGRYYLPPSD